MQYRVGRNIKAKQVRVIGEDGKQIGILPLEEALKIAEEKGLDLVEIVPNADPPVCKIVDFGKFLYEQKKKEKEIKKSQKIIEVKEMQFSPTIQDHDIEIKAKKIIEWMKEGEVKVKLVVKGKGREALHDEVMRKVIDKVMQYLSDSAQFEKPPYKEGRNLVAIITPKRK
jgi:translation initiation factor IF-3